MSFIQCITRLCLFVSCKISLNLNDHGHLIEDSFKNQEPDICMIMQLSNIDGI